VRVHPDLVHAATEASRWRVLPAQRGFNVWRFYPWTSQCPGWRIIVAGAPTKADGYVHILSRMGLTCEKPAESLAQPSVSWTDAEWL
jgi:hypothetical protein